MPPREALLHRIQPGSQGPRSAQGCGAGAQIRASAVSFDALAIMSLRISIRSDAVAVECARALSFGVPPRLRPSNPARSYKGGFHI